MTNTNDDTWQAFLAAAKDYIEIIDNSTGSDLVEASQVVILSGASSMRLSKDDRIVKPRYGAAERFTSCHPERRIFDAPVEGRIIA